MKFIIYFIIFILYTEHACLTNLDKLIKDYEEQQKEKENGI